MFQFRFLSRLDLPILTIYIYLHVHSFNNSFVSSQLNATCNVSAICPLKRQACAHFARVARITSNENQQNG